MATNKIAQFEILASGIEVDGHPLAGGIVRFYAANTTQPQAVYDANDYTGSRVQLTLDGQGRGIVYGYGLYDITVSDALDTAVVYTFSDLAVGTSTTASVTIDSDYILTGADVDYIFADATNGQITIYLPTYALFNTSLNISKKDNTANKVIIDAAGSELIDAALTYELTNVLKNVTLIPDPGNSKWVTAGSNYLLLTGGTISGDLAVSGTTTSTGIINTGDVATTTVTVGDGSAAAPAITNSGDTNTGIFFPAADTIAFSNGNSEKVRILSTGNVGIGVTDPAHKFVVGDATNRYFINTGTGVIDTGTSTNTPISYFTNSVARLYIAAAGNIGIGNESPDYKLTITGNLKLKDTTDLAVTPSGSDWSIANSGAGGFLFSTNGSEKIRLTSAGSLYVGATSDDGTNSKLQVAGGISSTTYVYGLYGLVAKEANRSVGTGYNLNALSMGKQDGVSGYGWIQAHGNSVYQPIALNALGGYVGVGTTNPQALLHIDSAATSKLRVSGASNTIGLDISSNSVTGHSYIDSFIDNNTYNVYFRLRSAGTPVNTLTLMGTGEMLIGSTSTNGSGSLLQVFGSITIPNNTPLYGLSSGGNPVVLSYITAGNKNAFGNLDNQTYIYSNGSVLINGTDAVITSATIGSQTVATAGNADTVDTYHASTTPGNNIIPVGDSSGRIAWGAKPAFRGALVYTASDGTNVINFAAESYDTDSIHDNSSNTSRLTVPANVTKVRLIGKATAAPANGASLTLSILKGGSGTYLGAGSTQIWNNTGSASLFTLECQSPVLNVSAGEYFELSIGGQSVGIYTSSQYAWFAMEIIE